MTRNLLQNLVLLTSGTSTQRGTQEDGGAPASQGWGGWGRHLASGKGEPAKPVYPSDLKMQQTYG